MKRRGLALARFKAGVFLVDDVDATLAADQPVVAVPLDQLDLHLFAHAYPERFYQMGMAEQLLFGAAAGPRPRSSSASERSTSAPSSRQRSATSSDTRSPVA